MSGSILQLMVQAGSISISHRGTKRFSLESVGADEQLYPAKAKKQSFEE